MYLEAELSFFFTIRIELKILDKLNRQMGTNDMKCRGKTECLHLKNINIII